MFKVGEVIGICGNSSSDERQQSWNDWRNQLLDTTEKRMLAQPGIVVEGSIPIFKLYSHLFYLQSSSIPSVCI